MSFTRALTRRGARRQIVRATIATSLIVAALPLFHGVASAAPGDIHTYAGNGTSGYSGDGGPATSAQLGQTTGVDVDAGGNLYVVDNGNCVVRKVTATGTITTVAGNGTCGYSGDGGPATSAELRNPQAVDVDAGGNLYITDTGNNRVRKVAPTGTITTVAGNGTAGYSGDGGPATSAELNIPIGIATDAAGNAYIGDQINNRVRKVAPTGTITTVAGNGVAGSSGDGGPATSAELNHPLGMAVDSAGNLYIAESDFIRKVTAGGTISTVAGNGFVGYSGDGGPATSAELNNPTDVDVDSGGNLYITDQGNSRIRMVTTGGTISTVAGNGVAGYSGDGGPATSAELDPRGAAVDGAGNLYIADGFNDRVRKVDGSTSPPPTTTTSSTIPPPPGIASDGCDAGTNIASGFVDNTYLKVKTISAGASTSVCLAAETAGVHLGGKLTVGTNVPTLPAGVDLDPASVAACSTNANNKRVDGGVILGEPWWIDLTISPVGSTDAAWVCLRATNSVGFRFRIGGVPGIGILGFTPDPLTPHVPPYAENPWPVSNMPSAACMAAPSGKTRIVNATLGGTPVATYLWQETLLRAHLCFRVGTAGGVGGQLTIDGGAPLGIVSTTNNTAPCPFTVFTSTTPSLGLFTSTPDATPISVCLSVLGTTLGVTVNPSGGGAVGSLMLDPA